MIRVLVPIILAQADVQIGPQITTSCHETIEVVVRQPRILKRKSAIQLQSECVSLRELTGIVLVGLLEVIKVHPTTVNVEFVINDSGLVSESSTKVILWVLSGDQIDTEQD